MKRWLVWAGEHPVRSLLSALVLASLFATGLPRVRFDASIDSLRVPARGDATELTARAEAEAAFGGQSVMSVVVSAADVFEPGVLHAIEEMTWEFQGLEPVQRVVSLATVSGLEARDGFLDTEPLLAWVPEGDEELRQLRRRALDQPVLRGEVIDDDGNASALHLFVSSDLDDAAMSALRAEVDAVIAKVRSEFLMDGVSGSAKIFRVDEREIGVAMIEAIRLDSVVLVPVAGLLVLVLIGWHFRDVAPFSAVCVPVATGSASIVATLGFMGWCGLELTPVAAIVPTLLLVVGCTEDVHLLAAWAEARRRGASSSAAVAFMAEHGATAILVTSLTTAVGFLSIVPNPLPVLREFGLAASFGMAINLVFTALLVPALLRLLPSRGSAAVSAAVGDSIADEADRRPDDRAGRWAEGLLQRAGWLPVGTVAFAVVACWGAARVEVDTDYVSFLRSGHDLRQRYDAASEAIAGASAFWVVLDSGVDGGAVDPRWQQQIDRLAAELDQRFDKVLGLRDFLRRLHRELNDGEASFDRVPDSSELIAQYLLMLDPDDVERVLDFERRHTALVVRSSPLSSGEMLQRLEFVERWVERHLPGTGVHLLGDPVVVSRASDAVSRSLVGNLALVLVTVFGILSVLFWSLRAGILAMLPNLFPMLGVFAAMGWAGVPLSTATFPVAVIALGIAVDDTVHFMVRLAARSRAARDNRAALVATIRDEFAPVTLTSAALVLGFLGLTTGRLQSTAQFGALAALAMVLAWFADLAVAPLVLQRVPLIRMWDLLRLRISREVIEKCALFEGLSARQARRVAVLGSLERITAGDQVMSPDDHDRDVVALLRGHLAVDPTSQQDRFATVARKMVLEPGSVVGEVAFFTGEERSASVVALEDCEVLRVDAAGLERLQRRDPAVAARVYFNLSRLLGERFREVQNELRGAPNEPISR